MKGKMPIKTHKFELLAALETIEELVLTADPVIPATLPGSVGVPADPPAAIAILNGILMGVVEPELATLAEATAQYNVAERAFATVVSKTKDPTEAEAGEADFVEFMTTHHAHSVTRSGRARVRHLNALRAEIHVRLSALRIQAAAVAAAVVPGAAAPAPPIRQFPPTAPRRFGGNSKEYNQFIQIYNATYGHSTLAEVEKLSRLMSLLDGEPRRMLEGLQIIDANFPIALRLLEKRYGDNERVARELRGELYALPYVRSTKEIREFQIKTDTLVQQLANVGHPPASEETIMSLEAKLPYRCLEKLLEQRKVVEARVVGGNVWNLDEFRTALETIVSDEEKVRDIAHPTFFGRSENRQDRTSKVARKATNYLTIEEAQSSIGTSVQRTNPNDKPRVNRLKQAKAVNNAKKLAIAGAKSICPHRKSVCFAINHIEQVFVHCRLKTDISDCLSRNDVSDA